MACERNSFRKFSRPQSFPEFNTAHQHSGDLLTAPTGRTQLEAFVRKAKKAKFCSDDVLSFEYLCEITDKKLFKRIIAEPEGNWDDNMDHVLKHLLPPKKTQWAIELRPRGHNYEPPNKNKYLTINSNNFLTRMLYSCSKVDSDPQHSINFAHPNQSWSLKNLIIWFTCFLLYISGAFVLCCCVLSGEYLINEYIYISSTFMLMTLDLIITHRQTSLNSPW